MNNQEQMEAYARDMLTSYWMQSQQPEQQHQQQPQPQPQQAFMPPPHPTMGMSPMPFGYSPMQPDPMQSWLHQQLYQPASPPMSDISSPSPQYYHGNKTMPSPQYPQQQLPTPTPSPPTAVAAAGATAIASQETLQNQAHEKTTKTKSQPVQADSTFWEPRETAKAPAKKKTPWWKKSYQPKRAAVIKSKESPKKDKKTNVDTTTPAPATSTPPAPAPPQISPQHQQVAAAASPSPAAENHQMIQTPFSPLPIPSQQSGFFVYYTPPPPPPPAPVVPEPVKTKERKTTMANPREDTNDKCLIM
ncbi:unnamed protein product [Absidia cylindrospora]